MILPQVATIRNNIVLQAEKERREKAAKQERRELAESQDLERRRRDAEGFERSLRKKLSVGDLLTMHKEGRSYSDETILQVVELNKDESGNLHSITLSDGEYVSHNIKKTTFLTLLLSLHFFCGIRCQSSNYLENQFPEKIYSSNLCAKSILFKKLAARWC